MIIRRRHTLGLFGASILALSALLLLAPASTGQAAGLVAHQLATNPTSTSTTKPAAITTPTTAVTATPSPISAPTPVGQDDHPELSSASTCANPSKQSNSNAFIDYCSPSFANDVEGPWGAHITFTVNTAGKQAREIYLFAVSPAANNECATIGSADLTFKNGSLPDLGQLVSASGRAPVNLSFTWTFPTNDFSTTSDYCLALQLSGGNTVSSSTGFSLLSRQAPCIAIYSAGDQPDCSAAQKEPLKVLPGETVSITGKNWLPEDQKQTIDVSLSCLQALPGQKCPSNPIKEDSWSITDTGAHDIGGVWKLDIVQIPKDLTGQYEVQATMASGAITFGDSTMGKGPTFIIDILPHPCVGVSTGGTCAWSGATNHEPQSAAQGKYVTISGNNWQPTSKVSIYLLSGTLDESDCAAHRPKSSAGVSQFSALSGSVSGQVPLPTKAKVGDKYTICASGPSPASGTSDQVYAAVHINITKGATHQPFSLLSLLALLFALISLGVFVMTMPRRAAVPQPVGRRQ